MKRVLVTGVCGLIGSALADRLLEKGYHVTGIDNLSNGRVGNIASSFGNTRFVFRKIDAAKDSLLSDRALTARRFDIIVHLAASKKIGEDGSSFGVLTNNVDSTRNMLELARKKRATFIFASTSDVYGISKDIPFREEGDLVLGPPHVRRWSYAASKLFCEHLVFAYHYEYGLPVVILRYFGCFGPRSNYGASGGHIPLFIRNALEGKAIPVHGDGSQTRSMASVADVVRGTLLAMESRRALGNIINIGSDEEMSVRQAAGAAIAAAKRVSPKAGRARIRFIPMKRVFGDYREIKRRVPSLEKAKKLLGYSPTTRFKEAVEATTREMYGALKKSCKL